MSDNTFTGPEDGAGNSLGAYVGGVVLGGDGTGATVTVTGNTVENAAYAVYANDSFTDVVTSNNTATDASDMTRDFSGEASAETFQGGDGADNVTGSDFGDTIDGGDGDDVIDGGHGDDYLASGTGNDTIIGGEDEDTAAIGNNNFVAVDPEDFGFVGTVTNGAYTGTITTPFGTKYLEGVEIILIEDTGSDTYVVVPGLSIQDMIDAAAPGDTIMITEGTYNEAISLDGKPLSIVTQADVILDGTGLGGANGITLDGDFGASTSVSIDDLTIQNFGGSGIQFKNGASLDDLSVTNANVLENGANGLLLGGGYALVDLANLTVTDSAFTNNGSNNTGDSDINLFMFGGDATLSDSTITGDGTGENAIQLRNDYGDVGTITVTNIAISGSYEKAGLAAYNHDDLTGLTFDGVTVNAQTDWALSVNVGGVGGDVDLSGIDVTGSNGGVSVVTDDGDSTITMPTGANGLYVYGGNGVDLIELGDNGGAALDASIFDLTNVTATAGVLSGTLSFSANGGGDNVGVAGAEALRMSNTNGGNTFIVVPGMNMATILALATEGDTIAFAPGVYDFALDASDHPGLTFQAAPELLPQAADTSVTMNGISLEEGPVFTLSEGVITDAGEGAQRIIVDISALDLEISNASDDDTVIVDGLDLGGTGLVFADDSGSYEVETNAGTVSLSGDFDNKSAIVSQKGTSGLIEFVENAVAYGENLRIEDANGLDDFEFLTGDGQVTYTATKDARTMSGNSNALGYYEIDEDGFIVHAQVLFDSDLNGSTASETITGIDDGHELGFFIFYNDGGAYAAGDVFDFLDANLLPLNVAGGDGVAVTSNAAAIDLTIFFSHAALNADGQEHVAAGAVDNGNALTIGFEDTWGGGDQDYQDVPFTLEQNYVGII